MEIAHRFKAARSFVLAAALYAGAGFITHAFAQERAYLIDLNSKKVTWIESDPTFPTVPTAINDAGQVVGIIRGGGRGGGFITGPDGVGIRSLGNGGGGVTPSGINAAGQVAGGGNGAFITGPDGVGMRDLGTLGGSHSWAYGINNAGQVVGSSSTPQGSPHAFITGPDGAGMTDLGTLGGYHSFGWGINDAGQVVGESYTSTTAAGKLHAFITGPDGVGMRDLGTLGGNDSFPTGVNDAGQVVGAARAADNEWHGFITGPNGAGMRDLGTSIRPSGINDAGEVAGQLFFRETPDVQSHAVITGPNGVGITDLNSLVKVPDDFLLINAVDINNEGQVIAIGVIPEPESYAMFLAGLGLIGLMTRRKRLCSSRCVF